MYSRNIRNKAKELREQGYSYSHISKVVGVVKSTLSLWLKDVQFFPNETTRDVVVNAQRKLIVTKRADKAASLNNAVVYAEKNITKLSARDILLLGFGIYIGEGSKAYHTVRIVNSDPRIIKFSIRWLKESFGLTDKNIKIRLHIYPDINEKEAVEYWSKELGLGCKSFQSCYIDKRTNKKKSREGILPFGTAHMTVVSNGDKSLGVLLHRKILATIDRVLALRD